MALRIRIFTAGEYLEAVGGNAPFTGADRTAHQVKGDGHVAMRRVADRAERHIAAEHAPSTVQVHEDLPFRLDFVQGDRLAIGRDLERIRNSNGETVTDHIGPSPILV